MRVAGFAVSMTGRQTLQQTYSRQESLRTWTDQPPERTSTGDRLEISPEARQLLATERPPESRDDPFDHVSAEDRIRILVLEAFFGVHVKVIAKVKGADVPAETPPQPPEDHQPVQARSDRRQGWGVAYDLHESYRESESLSVTAQGLIQTSDGKQIAFDVQFNLSRQFVQETHVRYRAGDARLVDPLVIVFDGHAADLTTTRFRFDLDVDGTAEEIPFLRPGSGFLALDRNGDGAITDGSELFGPASGDGFADLAQLDEDGNRWIDAGDSVFERLRIWTKDAEGRDQLFAVGQKGIGAILLGSVDAEFTMKDPRNHTTGQNQKVGLYLKENGTAGIVQQLDVAL